MVHCKLSHSQWNQSNTLITFSNFSTLGCSSWTKTLKHINLLECKERDECSSKAKDAQNAAEVRDEWQTELVRLWDLINKPIHTLIHHHWVVTWDAVSVTDYKGETNPFLPVPEINLSLCVYWFWHKPSNKIGDWTQVHAGNCSGTVLWNRAQHKWYNAYYKVVYFKPTLCQKLQTA